MSCDVGEVTESLEDELCAKESTVFLRLLDSLRLRNRQELIVI